MMIPPKLVRRKGTMTFSVFARILSQNRPSSGVLWHPRYPLYGRPFVSSKGFSQLTLGVSVTALVVMKIAVVTRPRTSLVAARSKSFWYSKRIYKGTLIVLTFQQVIHLYLGAENA